MTFNPRYIFTPTLAQSLKQIESSRQAVEALPLHPFVLASLRETSKLSTTHYSTQIEGNTLSPEEVCRVVGHPSHLIRREREKREVIYYYRALRHMEEQVARGTPITEEGIQRITSLVTDGKKAKKSYRGGQNVLRDSGSGTIVYMPPRADDVPRLMRDLVTWIQDKIKQKDWPIPIVAGLAHYQFATIHPYYDGNGRTARLLASWILQKTGYGLKGIYSLEEYYANDLEAYYRALEVSDKHNYYEGRPEADLTAFLEYFCQGMAIAFRKVEAQIRSQTSWQRTISDSPSPFLLPEQRLVLGFFQKQSVISSHDVANILGITARQARAYCQRWMRSGFLQMADPAKRSRRYRLGMWCRHHELP